MADGNFGDRLANYASAGLRWGLMVEDHPDAERTYYEGAGADLGEPFSIRWPDKRFVVCTIAIPGHAELHYGYKEIPKTVRRKRQNGGYDNVPWEDTYDNYAILQTQACGRALRSAGYPHSIPDLKLVMLWRHRNAEVDALLTALDAAAGDEDDDGEEGEAPSQQTRTNFTTQRGPSDEQKEYLANTGRGLNDPKPPTVGDVLTSLLADDVISGMWDQLTNEGKADVRAWVAERGSPKPSTVRAYVKHVLDQAHKAMTNGDPAQEREEEKPQDWVQKAADLTSDAPPVQPAPPLELTAEEQALHEGIAEVRGRMVALAAEHPNDYAICVGRLEEAGITLNERLTMEQLILADEIVSDYEPAT